LYPLVPGVPGDPFVPFCARIVGVVHSLYAISSYAAAELAVADVTYNGSF